MSASSVRAVTMMIGSSLVRAVGAQLAREGEPRLARQHPVEQHEVGQRRLQQRLRGLGVGGALHLVPGVDEVDLDQLEDRRLVLDHQHGRAHSPATSARICSADAWRTSLPLTSWTTASAMFFAWSPMRSIDLAMNTISSAGVIVRGSSIM